jgi:hypothetical protein
MTFAILKKIIEKYNIQEDVTLYQDCGWECGATVMDGVWYNAKKKEIQFTQIGKYHYKFMSEEELDEPYDRQYAKTEEEKSDWKLLYFKDPDGDAGEAEI